jgi:hypothetical protein
MPSAYLIGQEFNPHDSVGDRIDLLAFDPDSSSLVVIELKRDRNKFQLLQSLSYAAMVATWDKEQLIAKIQRDINPNPSELIDDINNNELNANIKIILVAETYDPEVIITADWLSRTYGVDVTAFTTDVLRQGDEIFINLEQRLPLKELADVYERRTQRQSSRQNVNEIEWEDVTKKLNYSFGKEAVKLFTREKVGEPSKKRITSLRKQIDGFNRLTVYFPENYLRVYVDGNPDNAESIIQSKFSTPVEISQGANFFTFKVQTDNQFTDFLNWLGVRRDA